MKAQHNIDSHELRLGSDGRERHILMINAAGGGKLDVYYWIGVFNSRTYRFTPDYGDGLLPRRQWGPRNYFLVDCAYTVESLI